MKVTVTGIVQGVGFRPFIYRTAVRNRLNGYVRNLGDAGVEILLEGSEENAKAFLKNLRQKRPPLAQIHEIVTARLSGEAEFKEFTIHRSSVEKEHSGSVIPPDVAVCDECLCELRQLGNRRHDYFFITCTDCGPRYTIIKSLPYDRQNTTMQEFRTCSFCGRQYGDPVDRRFHAQTVACPVCGPRAYLTTSKGEQVESKDPIREAGKLLSEGNTLAVKGYGGFHVAASTVKDEPLVKLRKVKHRSQKPFAIMARDMAAVRTLSEVSEEEAKVLTSWSRPIVLLDKKRKDGLSGLIAPGLHNIGVMLPYTGLHHMLFDGVKDLAFVMTSANPPNQPIIADNKEALKTLSDTVDYFLFHNRQIAQRCDDSVLRMHGNKRVFIRRSRGYAPAPVMLKGRAKRCVIGLGGELNNTACILLGNKVFISQHVGDVGNVETRDFLRDTVDHLISLTNGEPEAVACDLHPKFTTTRLARDLAEEERLQLIQVQHHYAHIAAMMVEHAVDEMIGICCDGYGYGTDGEAWGGEILLCSADCFGFKRLGHLEEQPLIGGDLATRYPLRMAAGILHKSVGIKDWLMLNRQHFPHGEQEAGLILHLLEKGQETVETTSCGRVLDAVAAVLGVCYERTYEGEPSMKLESAAMHGKDLLKLDPAIRGSVLDTTQMLLEIFENRQKYRVADLAFSAHAHLAKGLAAIAAEQAHRHKVRAIAFSGGVACNQIITSIMRKTLEPQGFNFVVHETIPPGDGGLSFGQAVAAGFTIP